MARFQLASPQLVRRGLLLALLTIILDQLSKWYLLEIINMPGRAPIEVTSFFNLVMVWNYGVSFGMLSHPGTNVSYFLIAVAVVIVAVMLGWLTKITERWLALATGLIIGGALGNVIDRLRFGAVADFFHLHAMGYHWPAFNVADSAICIGVMMLLFDGIRPKSKT